MVLNGADLDSFDDTVSSTGRVITDANMKVG